MPAPTFNRFFDALGAASRFVPPILRGIRPTAKAIWGSEYLMRPPPDMAIGLAGGQHTAPAGDASAFALERGDVDAWVLWWAAFMTGAGAYALTTIDTPTFYKANRVALNTQQLNVGTPTRRAASRGDMELGALPASIPNFEDTGGSPVGTAGGPIFVPRNVALHWWAVPLANTLAITWLWVELPREGP